MTMMFMMTVTCVMALLIVHGSGDYDDLITVISSNAMLYSPIYGEFFLLRYTVVHTVCHRANLALYFFHSFIHTYVYQHLYFHTCIMRILIFSYYDIVTLELPIFISWA